MSHPYTGYCQDCGAPIKYPLLICMGVCLDKRKEKAVVAGWPYGKQSKTENPTPLEVRLEVWTCSDGQVEIRLFDAEKGDYVLGWNPRWVPLVHITETLHFLRVPVADVMLVTTAHQEAQL